MSNNYKATAFVSCSLRSEDKPFVDYIEQILIRHQIKPFGTVGRYDAAPLNPAEHMKNNIPEADLVVIVATPRYLQRDLQTGKISYGLSEMVHVETGMAYMANKPVVVFVQKGTHVGSFLPNVTQYVILDGAMDDLKEKWSLINSLLGNACKIVEKINGKKSNAALGKFITTGLAIFGGIKIVQALTSENKPKRKYTKQEPRKKKR